MVAFGEGGNELRGNKVTYCVSWIKSTGAGFSVAHCILECPEIIGVEQFDHMVEMIAVACGITMVAIVLVGGGQNRLATGAPGRSQSNCLGQTTGSPPTNYIPDLDSICTAAKRDQMRRNISEKIKQQRKDICS